MSVPKRIYLYPDTPFGRQEGANDYLYRLRDELNGPFRIVNGPTKLGMLHLFYHLPKTDIVYFNWIEDLADKQFGYLQVAMLVPILVICRVFRKRIVWFVHNNTSHSRSRWRAKRFTARLLSWSAHSVLTHVPEGSEVAARDAAVFDHPVPAFRPVPAAGYEYDLLLWGAVSPYKGVLEFVRLHAARPELRRLRVLVAGRFASKELYEAVRAAAHANVTISNAVIPEAELGSLMARSRYVFFSYQSPSVLASGALSRTLSFGKTVIGPDRGAFRALGRQGLVHTFDGEEQLCALFRSDPPQIEPQAIEAYAAHHSWSRFGNFLHEQLGAPLKRPAEGFALR